MTKGFGGKITINLDKLDDIIKQYKKINKYKKSNFYTIKTMDGTEEIVNSLIQQYKEDPI